MAAIQDEILNQFLVELSKRDDFTDAIVEDVKSAFSGRKKPKVSEVEKALSPEEGEGSL